MKKAIFLVYSIVYYRYYVALIEEALSRGYAVEVWHDYGHLRTGTKANSFPHLSLIPKVKDYSKITGYKFYNKEELYNKLKRLSSSDIVFSLQAPCVYWPQNNTQNDFKFKWFVLQHGLDIFHELSFVKNNTFQNVTLVAHSKEWIDKGREFLQKFSEGGNPGLLDTFNIIPCGLPEFDSFKYVGDATDIRRKYGIELNKKVLFYLPFPYQNWNPRSSWERAFIGLSIDTYMDKNGIWDHTRRMSPIWKFMRDLKYMGLIFTDKSARDCLLKGISEDRLFKSVKEFAKRNEMTVVVKPRLKFPMSQYIKENADVLVFDDEQNNLPPRFKELLSISSLVVSFCSLSALSAAFANVFHLNIMPSKEFFPNEKCGFFYPQKGDAFYNYEGISKSLTAQEAIFYLNKTTMDDFTVKQDKRAEYIKKYASFDDYCSSKRVFDLESVS